MRGARKATVRHEGHVSAGRKGGEGGREEREGKEAGREGGETCPTMISPMGGTRNATVGLWKKGGRERGREEREGE
jgi:hypothetical protein